MAAVCSASVALSLLATAPGVAAAGETMTVTPEVVTVPGGGTFSVTVVETTTGPTSGAQATLTFDPSVLQVASVTRAPAFAAAPILLPDNLDAAVSAANGSGTLAGIASAFLPPASVPGGTQDFITVELRAIGCGATEIGLPAGPGDAVLLDGSQASYGSTIAVATRGTQVSVDCGGGSPVGAVEGVTSGAAVADPAPAAASSTGLGGTLPLLLIALAIVVVIVIAAALLRRPRGA